MTEITDADAGIATPIVVSSTPTMPRVGIERLTEELKRSACFLEYGAGGSTCLAATLNVPHIFSVESDANYVQAVREAVAALDSTSTLHSERANIGQTKGWGMPVNRDGVPNWPGYPLNVWRVIQQEALTPDLVLIDGRFRVACFLASVLHLTTGATILFDDYTDRENYWVVERHVPLIETAGRMAVFKMPPAETLDLKTIAIDLAHHCVKVL